LKLSNFVFSVVFGAITLASVLNASVVTVKCGALIDGVTDVEQTNVLIELSGNIITGLRPFNATADVNPTIDLSRETCLPGLIDLHVHYIKTSSNAPVAAAKPLQPATADTFRRALNFGFTAVRNLGSDTVWPSDVEIRKAIEHSVFLAPRLKVSLNPASPKSRLAEGPRALRQVVDRMIAGGADWIKLFGDSTWVDPPNYSVAELSAMIEEAHGKGVKVAVHSIGPEDNHRSIICGADSIEHGVDIREEDLRRMHENGIVLVPTLSVLKYLAALPGQDQAMIKKDYHLSVATFQRAMHHGVTIAFGTDAGALEKTPWETANPAQQFGLMVDLGMEPMQAIKSGTTVAAKVLRMEDRIGSLTVGKFADIVAVPGNPLEDIRQLEYVDFIMKDGRRITRQ
jgi:imidazolonepropionase-like amidohydrolase